MQRILSTIVGVFVVATTASPSAQQAPASVARRLALRASAAIQATAFDAANGVLANTALRLRDARLGRIVGRSLTDKKGACIFKGLDRGSYVVEIVSTRQTTLAATPLISVNAGETVAAVVKLPFKPSLLEAFLGQESSSVASARAFGPSEAAGSGELVPTVVAVGAPVSER